MHPQSLGKRPRQEAQGPDSRPQDTSDRPQGTPGRPPEALLPGQGENLANPSFRNIRQKSDRSVDAMVRQNSDQSLESLHASPLSSNDSITSLDLSHVQLGAAAAVAPVIDSNESAIDRAKLDQIIQHLDSVLANDKDPEIVEKISLLTKELILLSSNPSGEIRLLALSTLDKIIKFNVPDSILNRTQGKGSLPDNEDRQEGSFYDPYHYLIDALNACYEFYNSSIHNDETIHPNDEVYKASYSALINIFVKLGQINIEPLKETKFKTLENIVTFLYVISKRQTTLELDLLVADYIGQTQKLFRQALLSQDPSAFDSVRYLQLASDYQNIVLLTFQQLAQSRHAEVRTAAFTELAALGNLPSNIKEIQGYLQGDHFEIWLNASHDILNQLVTHYKSLANHDNPEVRLAAVQGLIQIAHNNPVDFFNNKLYQELTSDKTGIDSNPVGIDSNPVDGESEFEPVEIESQFTALDLLDALSVYIDVKQPGTVYIAAFHAYEVVVNQHTLISLEAISSDSDSEDQHASSSSSEWPAFNAAVANRFKLINLAKLDPNSNQLTENEKADCQAARDYLHQIYDFKNSVSLDIYPSYYRELLHHLLVADQLEHSDATLAIATMLEEGQFLASSHPNYSEAIKFYQRALQLRSSSAIEGSNNTNIESKVSSLKSHLREIELIPLNPDYSNYLESEINRGNLSAKLERAIFYEEVANKPLAAQYYQEIIDKIESNFPENSQSAVYARACYRLAELYAKESVTPDIEIINNRLARDLYLKAVQWGNADAIPGLESVSNPIMETA